MKYYIVLLFMLLFSSEKSLSQFNVVAEELIAKLPASYVFEKQELITDTLQVGRPIQHRVFTTFVTEDGNHQLLYIGQSPHCESIWLETTLFPTDKLYEESLKSIVSFIFHDDPAQVLDWITAQINSINVGDISGQSQSHLVYQRFQIGLGKGNGEVFFMISPYSTAVLY